MVTGARGPPPGAGRRPRGPDGSLYEGSAGGQGQRARKSLQLALVSMLLPDVVFCWKINSANPAGPWPGAAGGGAAGSLADADPVPLPASSGPFLGPKRGGGAGGGQPGRDSAGAGTEPAPRPVSYSGHPQDNCPKLWPRARRIHRPWQWAPTHGPHGPEPQIQGRGRRAATTGFLEGPRRGQP